MGMKGTVSSKDKNCDCVKAQREIVLCVVCYCGKAGMTKLPHR